MIIKNTSGNNLLKNEVNQVLNQRIKDIMCLRAQQGFADPTPTLVDLERTHILYVNAHFKPFAAIGYEYNKVRANSGVSQYNAEVTFSIAQFGKSCRSGWKSIR